METKLANGELVFFCFKQFTIFYLLLLARLKILSNFEWLFKQLYVKQPIQEGGTV